MHTNKPRKATHNPTRLDVLQLLVFALLSLVSAILGAALGGFFTSSELQSICNQYSSRCMLAAARTLLFCVDLVSGLFGVTCVVLMVVAYFNPDVVRPSKIVARVLYLVTIFLLVPPIVVAPVGGDIYHPDAEDDRWWTYFTHNPQKNIGERILQQWCCTVVLFVLSFTSMLIAFICPASD